MPLSKQETVMGFVATCIEEVAEKLSLDYEIVFDTLEKYGLIDNYIVKHYEVLHTESRNNIVDDIIETLELRGFIPNP